MQMQFTYQETIFADSHLDWLKSTNDFPWKAGLSDGSFSFGWTLNSASFCCPHLDSTLLSTWALDWGSLVDVICVRETFFERKSCSSCLKRKTRKKKRKQLNWIVCLSNHSARFFHCNNEFILQIIVTVVDSKFQNPIHYDQIEVRAP